MTTAEQFLLGAGGKSAKFETIGASITGTIDATPEVRQQTSLETGTPLVWDNGDPKMQLVVTLKTELREDEDDDGLRKLYVKGSKDPASKSMHAAVAGAVLAAKAKGLEIGGRLAVTYTGDGVSKTRGFNPPKQYEATYQPPTGGEFLGTEQGSVNGATGEIATPDTTAPSAEQIAALKAAGVDPSTVFPNYQG